MYLKQVIDLLAGADQDLVVPHGFANPHSYRGFYERLAFEPAANVTIASMLACAREAVGQTYSGYKGGDYTMDEYTDCYLAEYGCTGSEMGKELLTLMLNEALLSVGRETSLVGELRAAVAERDALIKRLCESLIVTETREKAAHERARKAEDAYARLAEGVRECAGDGGCRASKALDGRHDNSP